jgi:hypothetical protein
MADELGLLKDYGKYIIGGLLIVYGIFYTYLCNTYGPIDE